MPADLTPLINAGMVFCDRHFGGINYPVSAGMGGSLISVCCKTQRGAGGLCDRHFGGINYPVRGSDGCEGVRKRGWLPECRKDVFGAVLCKRQCEANLAVLRPPLWRHQLSGECKHGGAV